MAGCEFQRRLIVVPRSCHLYGYNPPQTRSARRTVELLPESVHVLRALQPLHVAPDTLVFTATGWKPIEPENVLGAPVQVPPGSRAPDTRALLYEAPTSPRPALRGVAIAESRGDRVVDATSQYVLGSDNAERQRLLRQARCFRDEASCLLDQVGVGAGWRAVDVGCGPIGILDLLAERVGVAGQTIGVDNEPRMIEIAKSVAAELSPTSRSSKPTR